MSLFLRFHQSESLQVKQISLDEMNLGFAHASALQVERDSSEMRGCSFSVLWRGIAIVATQLMLNLDGANG
jgi:hypothetical protein